MAEQQKAPTVRHPFWDIYYFIFSPFTILGTIILVVILIAIAAARMALFLPWAWVKVEVVLHKARHIAAGDRFEQSDVDRVLLVMRGLDPKGRPDGFSWIREKARQRLARELAARR
ncbi:MAG: hypothetical protein HYX97_01645 [Chloroflexi bacterium]|nr:hypothetical protein [Chloroflexota bacterium]